MFKEKFIQVIDKLEKFWNNNKEEIVKEVEKKLGFKKPIKLYSMIDEIYDIFSGLWNISTYWHENDFGLDYSNCSGFYGTFKELNKRVQIDQMTKENNLISYNVTYKEDADVCTFWFVIEPDKIRDLKIHNNMYNAKSILATFADILDFLEPYKQQVMDNRSEERRQQRYNYAQARELEEIK